MAQNKKTWDKRVGLQHEQTKKVSIKRVRGSQPGNWNCPNSLSKIQAMGGTKDDRPYFLPTESA